MASDYCFIVAFGPGRGATSSKRPQEVAQDVRNLIDRACDAAFGGFPEHAQVSVALGGVMLAFADGMPERAMRLCTAVASQLDHDARTYPALTPVCAALIHGLLRQVRELGYIANFEGAPAIAAARILARLSAGQMAVEQSVWDLAPSEWQLGPALTLDGKHQGEQFQVRLHQQLTFPTASLVAPPPLPEPPAIMPYDALIVRVKDEIRDVLQPPRLQPLREALAPQASGVAVEDVLVPAPPVPMLRVLDHLRSATAGCLRRLTGQQPDSVHQIKTAAQKIVGWLVLLAVNREQVRRSGLVFNP